MVSRYVMADTANATRAAIRCQRVNLSIFFIGQYTGGVNAKIHTGIASIKQPKPSPNLYNLSGQRLSKVPARSLYIQNGKKILK